MSFKMYLTDIQLEPSKKTTTTFDECITSKLKMHTILIYISTCSPFPCRERLKYLMWQFYSRQKLQKENS